MPLLQDADNQTDDIVESQATEHRPVAEVAECEDVVIVGSVAKDFLQDAEFGNAKFLQFVVAVDGEEDGDVELEEILFLDENVAVGLPLANFGGVPLLFGSVEPVRQDESFELLDMEGLHFDPVEAAVDDVGVIEEDEKLSLEIEEGSLRYERDGLWSVDELGILVENKRVFHELAYSDFGKALGELGIMFFFVLNVDFFLSSNANYIILQRGAVTLNSLLVREDEVVELILLSDVFEFATSQFISDEPAVLSVVIDAIWKAPLR